MDWTHVSWRDYREPTATEALELHREDRGVIVALVLIALLFVWALVSAGALALLVSPFLWLWLLPLIAVGSFLVMCLLLIVQGCRSLVRWIGPKPARQLVLMEEIRLPESEAR